MKLRYLAPILALTALIFSGCSLNSTATGKKEVNLLGIIAAEQGSYEAVSPLTLNLASDELLTQKSYSGDKLTLLWGLVTLTDY
jgi:hypothetical protein